MRSTNESFGRFVASQNESAQNEGDLKVTGDRNKNLTNFIVDASRAAAPS
jgi:hypothetical protein